MFARRGVENKVKAGEGNQNEKERRNWEKDVNEGKTTKIITLRR